MPPDQPSPPRESPPGQGVPPGLVKLFAAAVELPVVLIAGIVIGGGAGWWLDRRLGSAPWLMLLFGLFGFAAGLREIMRRLSKDNS